MPAIDLSSAPPDDAELDEALWNWLEGQPDGTSAPWEGKLDEWGYLDRHLVCFDYSAPAVFEH